MQVTKMLYGAGGTVEHARESMGIQAEDSNKIFRIEWLRALENAPVWDRLPEQLRPKHIYIGIDPNAGGPNMMAIISVAVIMGRFMVIIFFY
jgi:hypothetical protein